MTSRPLSLARWKADRLLRRVRCRVMGRLYRDAGGDTAKSIIVAGVARSGTTWLAEMLRSQAPLRIMFEPFNSRHVAAFKDFPFHTYRRPECEDRHLESFTRTVLSGRIKDPNWIDRQVDCLRPRGRVIKDVRICLFLRWIHHRFPRVPLVFIVRHPCAVVASHLKLGWSTDEDVDSMLAQPELVEDLLLPHLELVRKRTRPHERTAIVWCVNNLVVSNQFEGGGLTTLFYEDLVDDPGGTIPGLFRALGMDYEQSVFSRLSRPSLTAHSGSGVLSGEKNHRGWDSQLTKAQIDDVMEIVRAFDLHHLYETSGRPAAPLV